MPISRTVKKRKVNRGRFAAGKPKPKVRRRKRNIVTIKK